MYNIVIKEPKIQRMLTSQSVSIVRPLELRKQKKFNQSRLDELLTMEGKTDADIKDHVILFIDRESEKQLGVCLINSVKTVQYRMMLCKQEQLYIDGHKVKLD